jgi:hypothetical protein
MRVWGVSRGFVTGVLLWLGAAGYVAGICWIDAFYIEPNYPRLVMQEVRVKGLPKSLDGVRIVHLSDLHIVKLGRREYGALSLVKQADPDVVCLTGDYVEDDGITPGENPPDECIRQAARFMSGLRAKHGVYAVTGNWDPLDSTEFEGAGVRMLDNTFVTLEIRGSKLNLASTSAVLKESPGLDLRNPTVVLDHFPDAADDLERNGKPVALVLAGHWHGGQVKVPFYDPFYDNKIKYEAGLYQVGRTQLYVTRGLGMHSYAVRFNCPCEVAVLVLRRG